jgi:hypothetical protein
MSLWKKEWKAYLTKRVKKDKIHPYDVWQEMLKMFSDFKKSYANVRTWLYDNQIGYAGLVKKEDQEKKKPKPVKEKVKDDVEQHKLKQKLSEVQEKYQVLAREKALGDRIEQVLRDELKALLKVNVVWRAPQVRKETTTKEIATLLLGDLHIGEKVSREEVYGFGEYNFDIFAKRLKFLSESIKSITMRKLKGYWIDKLVIFGLGDMVSGRIHEEIIENAEDIVFQVMNGAFVTAQFVLELSKMFKEIEIDGVLGNHGRVKQRVYYKKRYVNWDYMFYQMLGMFLANNDRIKCNFPKSFFLVKKIHNWSFLVLHGDQIRSWMRIPWYGIERMMWRLGDLLQGKGINVHYRVLGHFHNTGELDKVPGEMVINGSMIGGTEYSLINMAAFDRPTQLFFGVHEDIGMTWRYPLRLDLPGVDKVVPYKYNQTLDAAKYMKEFLK